MISKVITLGVGAAGYVLGARAGRERYEQIKAQALKTWNDPKVQQAASDVQDLAADQAPVAKDKATATAKKASSTIKDAADQAGSKAGKASKKAKAASDDEPEGIDLVAAASTTPDDADRAS